MSAGQVLHQQAGRVAFAHHRTQILLADAAELHFLAQIVVVAGIAVLIQNIDRGADPRGDMLAIAVKARVGSQLKRPAHRARGAHAVNAHAVVIQHGMAEGLDVFIVGAGQAAGGDAGGLTILHKGQNPPRQQARRGQHGDQDQRRFAPAHSRLLFQHGGNLSSAASPKKDERAARFLAINQI